MTYIPSQQLATCLLLGLTTAPWLQASPIYTWEDARGVIHFSDQPNPNANIVDLDVLPTIELQSSPPDADKQDTQSSQPITVRLLSPHDQQTLRDNQGIIKVAAATSQTLNKHHRAQLLLDGKHYGPPQSRLNWHLSNIDRGSHTLQAQISNNGKVIALSEVITVYLHRASRLQPQPPAVTPK
ncbi:DUF4124 domain-containing protein [Photobacterium alginatilyticum]|uniref:DUF4124 domain-containing protein n=1 Tax=Photobacterium alginatilyticum TaxID=1775171 RepID=A0ABW9YME3_9GAMM|nr:DUF4124 domain-containing protein [Photobacterium alginatilyticum]NBI54973.1 DUF4124 domain-containing protein [Photobacterium alginatilyticum]